jgi:hypothetical protein
MQRQREEIASALAQIAAKAQVCVLIAQLRVGEKDLVQEMLVDSRLDIENRERNRALGRPIGAGRIESRDQFRGDRLEGLTHGMAWIGHDQRTRGVSALAQFPHDREIA